MSDTIGDKIYIACEMWVPKTDAEKAIKASLELLAMECESLRDELFNLAKTAQPHSAVDENQTEKADAGR